MIRLVKRSSLFWILAVILCLSVIGAMVSSARAPGTFGLQYNLNYVQPILAGGNAKLVNSFTNSGTVPEQVTGISLVLDIGTFTASSGLPLSVPVGQTVELNMTEPIPSSASTGAHAVTATINFQYQDPSSGSWVTPSQSPLVVNGSINIANAASLANLALILGAIVGVIVLVVVVVLVLVLRRRKAGGESMPMPTMPPPSPPPVSSPPQ